MFQPPHTGIIILYYTLPLVPPPEVISFQMVLKDVFSQTKQLEDVYLGSLSSFSRVPGSSL